MNIGLVLSGGMAKGAYQVGALFAVRELFSPDDIKYISASSVGTLNGYAFSSDRLKNAQKLWIDMQYEKSRAFIGTVLRSSYLQSSIDSLCSRQDEIKAAFYTALFNLRTNTLSYHNLSCVPPGLLPQYLQASVSMPVYNKPVAINNERYYDGAMIDNIPVLPLKKYLPDYIICIYFDEFFCVFEDYFFDNRIIKLTFSGNQMIKDSVFFTKASIDEMIERGYEKTRCVMKCVFSSGKDDIEAIYRSIKQQNDKTAARRFRITGDLAVSNLNKLTQKFAKRKIYEKELQK